MLVINHSFDPVNENSVAELAMEVKRTAVARGFTIATAESCTGGMVGSAITEIPGSSACYVGGIVSYANSVKENVLGVSHDVLQQFGAVSSECAAAMARGAKNLLKTDVAISTTGIAGPDGGSEQKPVGTVWFGVAGSSGIFTQMCEFEGDRHSIREQATHYALFLLLWELLK